MNGNVGAALAIAVAVGVPILIIASIVLALRRGDNSRTFNFDLQALYLYIVALVSLVILLFSIFSLTDATLSLAFQTYLPAPDPQPIPPPTDGTPPRPSRDFSEDQARFARQRLAQSLAGFLVTLPVWWFHWQSARKRSFTRQAFLGHRLYLYAIMVIALIASVVSGGQALSRLFEWILGAVDWSGFNGARNFWKSTLETAINSLVALGLWTYHRRALGQVPDEAVMVDAGE